MDRPRDHVERRRWQPVVTVSAVAAVVALAFEYGFRTPPWPRSLLLGIQFAAALVYVAARVVHVVKSGNRWGALRGCWVDGVLLLGALVFLFFRLEVSTRPVVRVFALYVAVVQGVLIARLAVEAVRLQLMLSRSRLHPARTIAIMFVTLILIGAAALALPKATMPHVFADATSSLAARLIDCLFTATSATCVTGLTVLDTGSDFTAFGQMVILALIQAGGLGIMIFGGIIGLLVGRQLSLRQSLALQDSISHKTVGDLRRIAVFVVVTTFVVEAIGAALLYPIWDDSFSVSQRVFHSVFHSVSAFCNAGFSLQSDSLIPFRRSWSVYGCIMPLIVIGGVGFPVLRDLSLAIPAAVGARLRRRRRGVAIQRLDRGHSRLTLHTKLVLATTAVLIVVPTPLFMLFESVGHGGVVVSQVGGDRIQDADMVGRFFDALFLSVTCRTAGFNTVAMGADALTPASHMLGAILMFIGGSPGSTAGGVKTIAMAVLLLSVWTTLRGRQRVEIFGRSVPDVTVRRAGVVVIIMFALISVVTLTLCVTEGVPLRSALFESVSACGTVGLSTGITPSLTPLGRVVIMLAMVAGRLGPLTLLIALAGRAGSARYEYAREDVGIG